MGVRLLPKGAEEAVFKPVPEGWLFKPFNPWIVGPAPTYLVTGTQKPAIAARVRVSRYVMVVTAAVAGWLMVAAAVKYPWIMSATPEAIAVWGAWLIGATAVLAVSDWAIMRPLVRGLPRTAQKVGIVDSWRCLGASMSTTAMAFFAVFCGLAAAANLYNALAQGKILGWLGGAFMGFLAVFYGSMLIAKRRSKLVVGAKGSAANR